MVSIIIPSLNEGKALPRTLAAIFSQSYKDLEVVLINDGSSDNTDDAIQPFREKITYITHEKNLGIQVSRNEGIAVARGEYILVCDADIIMRPDMIEKMLLALAEHPECSFAYSSFQWEWKLFKSFPFDADRLKKMNYINTASLVRREHHPGFDVAIKKFQDWDVWLTIISRGQKGYYISEVLFSTGENVNRATVPGLSRWLPSIAYKIPWKWFGIRIKAIEKYERGLEAIRQKHRL